MAKSPKVNKRKQEYEVIQATEDPWIEKRARQKRDIEAVQSGQVQASEMNWLGSAIAKKAKVLSDIP